MNHDLSGSNLSLSDNLHADKTDIGDEFKRFLNQQSFVSEASALNDAVNGGKGAIAVLLL